jgi:hypothetical protein
MTGFLEVIPVSEQHFVLEHLFSLAHAEGKLLLESDLQGSRRQLFREGPTVEFLLDAFPEGPECLFMRIPFAIYGSVRLSLGGDHNLEQSPLGGLLILPQKMDEPFYWIPRQAALRLADKEGRILAESEAPPVEWRVGAEENFAVFQVEPGKVLDWVVWRFAMDQPRWLNEFHVAAPLENQGVFLWGSHATLKNLAGIYQQLIHGAVYDVRWAWPRHRKCCSENEAHALYTGLAGLEKATGKGLYRLLQQQLVLSAMARQAPDGGWYHGLWTDGMECHYRLHASGVHMLMDEYCRAPNPKLGELLKMAAHFLAQHTDQIDAGTWFLHDSLEKSPEAMNTAPFGWVSSRALGKSTSNMLVLNTHLDSTIALDRYAAITGDGQHNALVASARSAAQRVLALRTAEPFYRLLFWIINLSFLPVERASRLALPMRVLKRIGWKYLVPRLPAIKSRFPRLVMPGGYIDRELTLKTWAVDYHSINLMDLLRFYRRFGDETAYQAALRGLDFAQYGGLKERWREMKGKEYALGFWAEALYHQCTLSSEPVYRSWLAETMLLLTDAKFGLPPSLLGANSEAVSIADQKPAPVAANAGLRVANLSRSQTRELLIVNTENQSVTCKWLQGENIVSGMSWRNADGDTLKEEALIVAPRSWIRGVA